jgi:hypothetical protein
MINATRWIPLTLILLAGAATMLTTSAQDRTLQPGQPTQGKVWIQNRGDNEAVPVIIQNGLSGLPLQVQVTGSSIVTTASGSVVDARLTRQSWEYRNVPIAAGQDAAAALNAAGVEGWETTGIVLPEQGRTVVVLKRPAR